MTKDHSAKIKELNKEIYELSNLLVNTTTDYLKLDIKYKAIPKWIRWLFNNN